MAGLRSQRVVLPEGERPAVVRWSGGRITAIEPWSSGGAVDVGDAVVMPGLIDTHVHVDEPGRTEWEGFDTATRAAAAGGVTTIVDMPLNCIPATVDAHALLLKRREARHRCWVHVGFWGGVVPGNRDALRDLREAGVLGFKAFLAPTGVDEFQAVSVDEIEAAAEILVELGVPLLVHCEDAAALAAAPAPRGQSYAAYLASRPQSVEDFAISRLVEICRRTRAHVHVVHLATGSARPWLRAARKSGLPVTVETCPHYLTFAAEEIGDGELAFKCAPPIRESWHREELWRGLREGDIDQVASDHSPCPPELKAGDFASAWGGIASLQLLLPALWTEARDRDFEVGDIVRWLAEAPARLAGLAERKGRIAVGFDADLVVFEPDRAFTVQGAELFHRHPVTPWEGRKLVGVVRQTILAGQTVYTRQEGHWGPPKGELL